LRGHDLASIQLATNQRFREFNCLLNVAFAGIGVSKRSTTASITAGPLMLALRARSSMAAHVVIEEAKKQVPFC